VIFERPGLQKFLDFLFENFNVSVWSAASKDYVAFIVENILLHPKKHKSSIPRKLDYVLFSYHCKYSTKVCKQGIKSLDILWSKFKLPGFAKNNTIIVDDLDKVKKINKGNCLNVKEFNVIYDKTTDEDVNDTELSKVESRLSDVLAAYNEGNADEDDLVNSKPN
jgi:hypothetical protein